MALVFAPAANAVLGAVRPEEAGQASGANNAIRELGGVLGVAVLAAVFAGAGELRDAAVGRRRADPRAVGRRRGAAGRRAGRAAGPGPRAPGRSGRSRRRAGRRVTAPGAGAAGYDRGSMDTVATRHRASRERVPARARAAGDRHRVHARGPLPAAALPDPGLRRRGGRRARPARGRWATPRRSPPCSPTRTWRSSSTPGGRTSRSCAAPGTPRSRTCSTRRSRPASPASRAQAGYTGLLHDVLRIRVSKSASFTRWDARPLTPEQLRYAARGRRAPAAAGRRAAAAAARARAARVGARGVLAIAEATDERDPEEAWRRLPRDLGPRRRASARMARELAAWRERTAAAEDRPVGSVVRDPTLVELAKRGPQSPRELGQIRGAGPDVVRRRGAATSSPRSSAAGRPSRSRLDEGERLDHRRGRRPDDRAGGVARADPRAGGRPGLRADRRARRPGADRRRRPPRASRSPTCARCAAGAASWSATSCSSCWPARRRLTVSRRPRAGRLTRTTSKSLPRRRPSARSWSLSQPAPGAPETNQSEPLSATISPYSRIARATTRAWRGRPEMSTDARSRSRSPIRGSAGSRGVGGEVARRARRTRCATATRSSAARAGSGRAGPRGSGRAAAGSAGRRRRRSSSRTGAAAAGAGSTSRPSPACQPSPSRRSANSS